MLTQENRLEPHNKPADADVYARPPSGWWATFNSPSTPWTPAPGTSWWEPQRILQFDVEYWVLWSAKFTVYAYGSFNRILNFHQAPPCDPIDIYSSMAIDIDGNGKWSINRLGAGTPDGTVYRNLYNPPTDFGPPMVTGTWYDNVLHLKFNATKGLCEWWINGQKIGRWDTSPLGYTQARCVQMWEGQYEVNDPQQGNTMIHEAARVGPTFDKALADRPAGPVHTWGTIADPKIAGAKPGYSRPVPAQRPDDAFVIPAELRGGTVVVPPTTTPAPTPPPARTPVTVSGATATLTDGDVIIYDAAPNGVGHRLRPTASVTQAQLNAASGKLATVVGEKDVAATTANFPIYVNELHVVEPPTPTPPPDPVPDPLPPVPEPTPGPSLEPAINLLLGSVEWMRGGLGLTQEQIETTRIWQALLALGYDPTA